MRQYASVEPHPRPAQRALTSATVKADFDPDRAVASADAQTLFARKDPPDPKAPRVAVPTAQAMNQPLEARRQIDDALAGPR
ncbi:XVIPCD domain-containing protein [Lysobacter hankyongensis]|uniref:XVIPCD domain-containing protein n=1 Tax=Lysobacter hankyongensis TaxID=1176535 RepID=UPI0031F029CF